MDHIDKAAKYVINAIDKYHLLARKLCPWTQLLITDETAKLSPPITKSKIRQIKRIVRLRNSARSTAPKPKVTKPLTPDTQIAIPIQTKAIEVL